MPSPNIAPRTTCPVTDEAARLRAHPQPSYLPLLTLWHTHQDTDPDFAKRVEVATEYSTFAFMQKHQELFDEHLSKDARNEAMGLPRDAGRGNIKIRAGQVRESAPGGGECERGALWVSGTHAARGGLLEGR